MVCVQLPSESGYWRMSESDLESSISVSRGDPPPSETLRLGFDRRSLIRPPYKNRGQNIRRLSYMNFDCGVVKRNRKCPLGVAS
jgi:hypothetical protein